MEYTPKISIIIPVYNRAKTLEQAISSIVRQTYRKIELIVIDGGSTDGTLAIIKKYETKIAYWVSEPDGGIYDAMNKGCRAATGDYIEIIGSDDALCSPDAIERAVAELEPEVDILSCCQYVVDEQTGRQKIYANQFAKEKAKYHGGMVPHGGMFVRSGLLREHLFDTSYKLSADYKFFLTCYYLPQVKMKFIPLPVLFFSMSGVSNTLGCAEEDARLHRELHLPFTGRGWQYHIKRYLRIAVRKLHLLALVRYGLWEKHVCGNEICRWCGREA